MKNYFATFLIFLSFTGLAQNHYLQCGQILDVESGKLLSEKTLVVTNNRIAEVLDGYREGGADDTTIDLRTMTVMPGFSPR